jgi:hypothetical protein
MGCSNPKLDPSSSAAAPTIRPVDTISSTASCSNSPGYRAVPPGHVLDRGMRGRRSGPLIVSVTDLTSDAYGDLPGIARRGLALRRRRPRLGRSRRHVVMGRALGPALRIGLGVDRATCPGGFRTPAGACCDHGRVREPPLDAVAVCGAPSSGTGAGTGAAPGAGIRGPWTTVRPTDALAASSSPYGCRRSCVPPPSRARSATRARSTPDTSPMTVRLSHSR